MVVSGLQAREGVVGVLHITDLDLVGGSQAEFLSLNLGLENTFGHPPLPYCVTYPL